jgi:mRNA-degrading endonuclease toxin of MazEF toxin-antitoxin module
MRIVEERTIFCPYCGERMGVEIDMTAGDLQDFIEDCPVCCRAIEIVAKQDIHGHLQLVAKREDDV